MIKFDTTFKAAARMSRWFNKAADGSLPLAEYLSAQKAKNKIKNQFTELEEASRNIAMSYQEKLMQYKQANPKVDLETYNPPELQLAWTQVEKDQKELSKTPMAYKLEQKEFQHLQTAVDNIVRNLYEMIQKKNKGEKFDEKEPFPTEEDLSLIAEFKENMDAFEKDKKGEKSDD